MPEIEDLLLQMPDSQSEEVRLPSNLVRSQEPEDILLQQYTGGPPTAMERKKPVNSFDPVDMLLVDAPKKPQDVIKPEKLEEEKKLSIIERRAVRMRKGAKDARGIFGNTIARMMYGNRVVDQLPDKPVPNKYKDAYIKDGEWFIPGKGKVDPPPEDFIEAEHGHVPGFEAPEDQSIMRTAATFILPESIAHLDSTLWNAITGSHYERGEALDGLIKGAVEINLYMGPVGKVIWQSGMKLLKWMAKTGTYTPRMVLRAMNRIGNAEYIVKPQEGMKGVPNPIQLVKEGMWETITLPFKQRFIPSLEGAKSMAEVFQPAVERMGKETAKVFRAASSQKALVTHAGTKLGQEVHKFTPQQKLEFARGIRGEVVKDPVVKEVIGEFSKKLGSYDLDGQYTTHFVEALQKRLKKADFGTGFEAEMPSLKKLLAASDNLTHGTGTVRQVRKALTEVFDNPLAPDETRILAMDLLNMRAATPEAVATAAKSASKKFLVENLKQSRHVKPSLGLGDSPKDWLVSKYPGLKGLWINRDVELELRALDQIPKMAHKSWNKWFMTPWKTSKVILRPATHIRNLFSNTILNDWGGLPFYRLDVYTKALKEIKRKGSNWREWQKLTGGGGTFSTSEVMQVQEGLRMGANMWEVGLSLFDRMAAVPRHWYNMEEQWFKLAKFMHNKAGGMHPEEAALDAMKYTFNYGEVTRMTGWIRGNVAPFFTWQSKVIPLMAETAVKHPLRFGKWIMFYEVMQNQALQNLNISDGEWEHIERILPEYIQEAQFLLMPWRDEQKRLQLLNLTYMVPGFGDMNEMASNPVTWMLGNPLVTIGGSIYTKTKFSGAPLYHDWEANTTKFAKAMSYTWQQLVPSWTPGPGGFSGIDWQKMMQSFSEDPNAPSWEQMMASSVGLKITPIDEARSRRRRRAVDNVHRAEIGSSMRRELRKVKSTEKRRKVIQKYLDLKRQIGLQ